MLIKFSRFKSLKKRAVQCKGLTLTIKSTWKSMIPMPNLDYLILLQLNKNKLRLGLQLARATTFRSAPTREATQLSWAAKIRRATIRLAQAIWISNKMQLFRAKKLFWLQVGRENKRSRQMPAKVNPVVWLTGRRQKRQDVRLIPTRKTDNHSIRRVDKLTLLLGPLLSVTNS